MTSARGGALLVVIDMQRVFAEPASPWCIPTFNELEQPILRLVEHFGNRTVFTRFLPADVPQGAWQAYYRSWSFVRNPDGKELLALASAWASTPHAVIDKSTFSGYGEELREAMRRTGTTEIVLCGVSTECCVLATALAAADDGIGVRIVRDACASVDASTHEAALHIAVTGFAPLIALSTVDTECLGA